MPPLVIAAIVAGSVLVSLLGSALIFRRPKWTEETVRNTVNQAVAEAVEKAKGDQKSSERREVGQALSDLYEKQIEGFGKTAQVLNGILESAGDLAVHRYAVALGSRGGRKRAANLEARKAPPRRVDVFDSNCEACNDPLTKNSQAIAKHVMESHVARLRSQNAQPQLPLDQPTNGSAAPKTAPLNN
jgi:hypothetical protein